MANKIRTLWFRCVTKSLFCYVRLYGWWYGLPSLAEWDDVSLLAGFMNYGYCKRLGGGNSDKQLEAGQRQYARLVELGEMTDPYLSAKEILGRK